MTYKENTNVSNYRTKVVPQGMTPSDFIDILLTNYIGERGAKITHSHPKKSFNHISEYVEEFTIQVKADITGDELVNPEQIKLNISYCIDPSDIKKFPKNKVFGIQAIKVDPSRFEEAINKAFQ